MEKVVVETKFEHMRNLLWEREVRSLCQCWQAGSELGPAL